MQHTYYILLIFNIVIVAHCFVCNFFLSCKLLVIKDSKLHKKITLLKWHLFSVRFRVVDWVLKDYPLQNYITLTIRAIIVLTNQYKLARCDNFSLSTFWGWISEQRGRQCFSPILVSDLQSNVIMHNILHRIDYAIITMFTI